MVSLECGQAAKGIGVRNVFPSSCGLSPGTFLLLRSNRKASYPGDRLLSFRQKTYGEGGVLPYKRLMGCAAGWGRISTTGLAIMESHFQ